MNTSESTAYAVIQAYFDVLQREEFVRLAEDDLANHERIYDQIKLRTDQELGAPGTLCRPKHVWHRRVTTC